MARYNSVDTNTIELQAGRRKFVQKIAFTTTGALTALSTTDVYGVTIPDGACLVLQADADFLYELRNAAASVSAVTNSAGSRPGTYVKALDEHKVHKHSTVTPTTYAADTQIDVVGQSGSGNLSIFWVS